jgi:hypothetical protein
MGEYLAIGPITAGASQDALFTRTARSKPQNAGTAKNLPMKSFNPK